MLSSAIFNLFLVLTGFSVAFANNQAVPEIIKKPEIIENKGIYLTAYVAGLKDWRARLVDLIDKTELNTVVIDIKDYSGLIFFDTNLPDVNAIGAEDIRIPDLKEWIAYLKGKGIYTIARITVFQDPYLAQKKPEIALQSKAGGLWKDGKGLYWVDPTQRYVWEYNLNLAKETVKLGFDEINFDYIRFPTDGNIKLIKYANLEENGDKTAVMAEFYEYLDKQMNGLPVLTSGDLFGMVLWRDDGLNIGQRLQDAMAHFDFVCPMVYPSHYPAGFEGFANPAEHPYEIIYRSLIRAKNLQSRAKIRPWLQAFDLGATYDAEKIRLQKKAVYEGGGFGWLLWNASNRYSDQGLEKN